MLPCLQGTASVPDVDEGVTRMLLQIRQPFDFLLPDSDFSRYALLILPDAIAVDDALARRLERYLAQGGKLLATGSSGLDAGGSALRLPALGIITHGASPFSETYFRVVEAGDELLPPGEHIMYEPGVRVTPAAGYTGSMPVVEPYFERTWEHFSSHHQTPPAEETNYFAVVQGPNTGFIAYPVFTAYARHGNASYRGLLRQVLERLLPTPLLRLSAPLATEATLTHQDARTIAHLLFYPLSQRVRQYELIEDIIPLHNVELAVRLAAPPQSVYLAPERRTLPFRYEEGYAQVTVPEIHGHAIVVFEANS